MGAGLGFYQIFYINLDSNISIVRRWKEGTWARERRRKEWGEVKEGRIF
jgi:hypothetical protein